jgi:uncharacterized protein (TIGR00251 family)
LDPPFIETVTDGVVLTVRVIPRASKSGVAGIRDDALLVRLAAPPVDGGANVALVELLASLLAIPRRQLSLLSGAHSRRKRLKVSGIDAQSIAARLAITIS